jgi:formylglycine-generating enzyme required for sulfatase activity
MNAVCFKFVVMFLAFTAQAVTIVQAQAQAQPQPPTGLPEVAHSRVDLGDFKIDTTEVSIGRFAEYVGRKGLVTAAEREGGGFEYVMGWQRRAGWTWRTPFGQPAQPSEPAAHVNWAEAQGFCQDAGGRLPTKAQWQQAAYTEQRASPPAPFEKVKLIPTQRGINPMAPTLKVQPMVGRAMRQSAKLGRASMVCMTWAPTSGSGWPTPKTVLV